ncbi:MAG: ArsA family ATPase [Leptonema sp. (in: bacteria)]
MNTKPNLHIFLGAGGVGKTTLSASYALYLAKKGKKTGLLSIDPAKRLKTALKLESIEENGKIYWQNPENLGYLRIAVLNLPDSLKRWISDEGLPEEHKKQLFEHPIYTTVAEKVASAVETLAPIRMAEWLEQYSDTEDLIIDTAPGIHAVDFIVKPERLLAFFDSKILQWLKWFTGETKWVWKNGKKEILQDQNLIQKIIRGSAKLILTSLGKAGGENILLSLGEFILLMDQVFYKMVERLEKARNWIRQGNVKFYFVFSLREDSLSLILELRRVLENLNLNNSIYILNRSLLDEFLDFVYVKEFLNKEPTNDWEALIKKYIMSFPFLKKEIYHKLKLNGIHQIREIPLTAKIEEEFVILDLMDLGEKIDLNTKIL